MALTNAKRKKLLEEFQYTDFELQKLIDEEEKKNKTKYETDSEMQDRRDFLEEFSPTMRNDFNVASFNKSSLNSLLPDVTTSNGSNGLFQSGAFSNGYDFGDVAKTILGSATDIGVGFFKGAANLGEGIGDAAQYGIANVSDFFGADEFAEKVRKNAQISGTEQKFAPIQNKLDNASIFGKDTTDFSEMLGYTGGIMAIGALTGGAGAKAGLSAKAAGTAATAATTGSTFMSSTGSGMSQAYNEGATDSEANKYGLMKGTIDAGTELLFGGLGKLVNATGLSKGIARIGGESVDDMFATRVSKAITNTKVKNAVEAIAKTPFEGLEEVIAGVLDSAAQKLTYNDEDFSKIIKDQDLFNQFLMGALVSGTVQVPSVAKSNASGRDYISNLTENETKVLDNEVNTRSDKIKKQQAIDREVNNIIDNSPVKIDDTRKQKIIDDVTAKVDSGEIDFSNEKVKSKDLKTITEQINRELERGDFSIRSIENTLFPSVGSQIDVLEQDLNSTQDETKKANIEAQIANLRASIAPKLQETLKNDSLLQNSYREARLKGENFTYEVKDTDSEYTKKLAEEFSAKANNQTKTHETFEFMSKLSNDRGTQYHLTSTEELNALKFDGEKIHGLVNKDGEVLINIDSKNITEAILGHETTHLLETTKEYEDLQKFVKQYAETKGEYKNRLAKLEKMYEGTDANIDNELTADMVGEYLFTDTNFVNSLSTDKPNIFKRIYDEVKHLYKLATAGSKEARDLEKVKKAFDKAYKANVSGKSVDGTKYSLGYHAGDLGKSEYYSQQGYSRGTGHFGTGTYFVGDKEKISNYNKRNGETAPQHAVEFDNYNLYKVRSDNDGYKLHDNLKVIDGSIDSRFIEPAKNSQWEFTDYTSDHDVDALEKKYGNSLWENESQIDNYVNIAKKYDIEIQSKEEFAKENKYEKAEDEEYLNMDYLSYLEKTVKEGENALNTEYRKFASAYNELKSKFGASAVDNAIQDVIAHENSLTDYESRKRADSNATVFMKSLGYEGIDTRGTALDNTTYGSVIYDVKPDTVRYSLSDTEGNTLTKEQQDKFKDSKVRDENGNLKVMYHGTSEDFTEFRNTGSGMYFTDNPDYARGYSRPDTANGGAVDKEPMKVYLDIKKPFDIRNDSEAKNIFINEYIKGGNAQGISPYATDAEISDYTKNGIDWTEGDNIIEFLNDNGYNYDGLVIDEGSDVDSNGNPVHRGMSYVTFNPNQIKNVDNTSPTESNDIRYSLSERETVYDKAIKSNDMKVAQELVDETAKEAGYTEKLYHQTGATFTKFNTENQKAGKYDSEMPTGIFMKPTPDDIGISGKNQMPVYAKISNPLVFENREQANNYWKKNVDGYSDAVDEINLIDKKYKDLYDNAEKSDDELYMSLRKRLIAKEISGEEFERLARESDGSKIIEEWTAKSNEARIKAKTLLDNYIKNSGYNGIVLNTDVGSFGRKVKSYIAFDSNQIKSADPVTYDDNGNVIPLSKRFNSSNEDIRYQLTNISGDTSASDMKYEPNNVEDWRAFSQANEEVLNDMGFSEADVQSYFEDLYKTEPKEKPLSDNPTDEETAKIVDLKNDKENGAKRLWAMFRASFVDKGSVFEDLSLKTKNRNLMGKWDYILTARQRSQNTIGNGHTTLDAKTKTETKTTKSITEMIDEVGEKLSAFEEYMYHKHNVDRMSLSERFGIDNKAVFGDSFDAFKSQQYVSNAEKENPQFLEWAKDVYAYEKADRQRLVDSGVINQETADLWDKMYPHYVPIHRVGTSGIDINVPLDTKHTGINSPIKRAKGGHQDFEHLFNALAERTMQTEKAIAKNNFGVELKNTLNSVVETNGTNVDDVIGSIEAQEGLLQKNNNGYTFTVFENGEKTTFQITQEMYEALQPISDSSWLSKTINPLNKASSFHRGVLTEYNPVFMLTNGIKDAQDIFINSQHAVKTYAKVPEALAQLVNKGYWYKEYMANGGQQNSFFDSQESKFDTQKNVLLDKGPLKWISDLNGYIEMTPRLAEYIASREAGRSVEVSMLDAARVTTNFKAGGDITKFANRNGATFLNASVQGFNQQVRNIREAKANGFMGSVNLVAKFAIAGIAPALLSRLIWDDDDDYQELSEYVKQNYYILWKDDDGNFIRVPKGRTLSVLQDAVNQTINFATGDDEVDLKSFLKLFANNLAPTNPLENNVFAPIRQAVTNKTWYGEDLVPTKLQDLPAGEQYDETTDKFSIFLGEKLGISPKKINYVLDQYTGGVGDTVLPMLTPNTKNNAEGLGMITAPLKDKFTVNATMNNQVTTDFYDKADKLVTEAKKRDATEEDKLKNKYFNSVKGELSELYQAKRDIQSSDLGNKEKYNQVKEIQKQINDLTRGALKSYDNVTVTGKYATVGDMEYHNYTNSDGENVWGAVKADEAEALSNLNMSANEKNNYFTSKNAISDITGVYADERENVSDDDKDTISALSLEKKSQIINVIKNSGLSDTQKGYLYDRYYTSPEKVNIITSANIPIDTFLDLESQGFTSDKDANGKTISGSKQDKVFAYLRSTNLSVPQRAILARTYYPSFNDYNNQIVKYVDNMSISYEAKEEMLSNLGMTVDENGNVTWGQTSTKKSFSLPSFSSYY